MEAPDDRFASEIASHRLVKWVQLCNGKAFPIFGVDAHLDRNSKHNDAEFLSLYVALSKANGSWPLAVVLVRDGWIDSVPAPSARSITSETFSVD